MKDEKDRQIKELEKENAKLREEKDKITQEKNKIAQEKRKLEKEFEEFKAQHAITVSNLKRALNIKPDLKKESKPLGAPKGHKGYSRHIPKRIDRIKQRNIFRCPHCNGKLSDTQEIRQRFITDVALTSKVINTRYDIHRKYCARCKKILEPDIQEALPNARFGLNIMLLVMYLKLGLRLSNNKICDFFLTLYNLSISDGEISGILRQLVVAFGDYYSYLEKIVKFARVKHTDSTSWRINGKNYFAWVFIACGRVIYKIRKRNNSKSPLTVFGTKQKGNTLVVDRHSALRALAEKAGFFLQFCWSHITDDSKKLAENFGAEGKYVHRELKEIYAMAKSLDHKGTLEQVEQFKGEIFQLTLRHYKHSTVRRFVNNLYYRDVERLFRFVTDSNIDSTNNISERELRHLVIIRKISFGSKSQRGAHATAMLLSVIQTLRLQKRNVLNGLHEIVNNTSMS
ncbi:MAG: IS66 family transposase [Proteobacteria bacterium]|nr:IS66 family transposase [Pseudomonadota bacterium]